MVKPNLVGKRFGRFTVITETKKGSKNNVAWVCKCDCGNQRDVLTNQLVSGRSKSCGCLQKELVSNSKSSFNKLYASYKKTATNKNLTFRLSEEDFFYMVTQNCSYCGIEPSNIMKSRTNEFVYNGIDRVDSLRGYEYDNVVTCCSTCNYAKRTMTVDQFLKWIKRIYITQYHKVTSLTPGQLIDLLFTTDYKCWWAQEDLMKYKDSDPEKSAQAAVRAQEYNAKRTKLMRTIDSVLDFSEDTNTEKTYSDGTIDETDNYTYFKDKK